MKNRHWYFSFPALLFCLVAGGAESYSELMDQAEKLTEKRYDRKSRAFKIKSQELDDILNSKESREEKIKRLQTFIRELQGEDSKPAAAAADPLKDLKEAAQKGEPDALYQLGMIYWEGRKQPRSLAKALHYFTLAAGKNHMPSGFMLALADLQGKGVIPNPKKAFSKFLRLYQAGYEAAGIPLGIQCYEGNGTEKNYKKAEEYLLAGLKNPSRTADLHPEAVLGKIYYFGGYGVSRQPARAFQYLKRSNGPAYERYLLGKLYLSGTGCSRDPAAAAECFRYAAEHGYNQAGTELGRLYYTGTGVVKDDRTAVRYLKPAIEFDKSPEAAFLLAEIFSDKKSPVFDQKSALLNYRIAARRNNAEAQYRVGKMILDGIGTDKNPKAALDYLSAAARQGHREAAYLCGEIELNSGHADRSLAFYRQAADAGHTDATRKFAGMALNGKGMKADPVLAIRYLQQLGNKADKFDLELLASLFESGIGPVKPDIGKAVRYYTLASEKGSIRAVTRLALIYQALGKKDQALVYAEKGAKAKDPEAIRLLIELRKTGDPARPGKDDSGLRYLRELADSGDRNAMRQYGIHLFRLGKLNDAEKYLKVFADGNDGEILFLLGRIAYEKENFKRAFKLFESASRAGHVKALVAQGRMYHRGEGVRQDFRQALICYRQAAERKDPEGMFQTGLMYYNAEGTSTDYNEACRWFRMAADKGSVLAMQFLSIMYKEGIGVPKNNIEAAKWRRRSAGSRP